MNEPDDPLAMAAPAVCAFAARPAFGLSNDELRSSLIRLQTVATLAISAASALVHEASGRDLPHADGAASTVAWLRDLLRITAADASHMVTLGQIIDHRPAIAAAVESGSVNTGQALAIGRVLVDVPAEDPALVDKVEAILIDEARQFEPTILRRLGERVLAHVNPDLAETRLRDRLERDDKHARQRRGFTLSPDGLGGTRITGILDTEGAAIIGAAIEPLTTPVHGDDSPDLRTAAARRADALIDVCRLALRTGELPASGGQPAQLTVTIDLEALRRDVAIGQLDTGAVLTPEATRRIACDAGIIPAILNGSAVPLDVGRARRPFTGATRTAILLRDGGCAFPGCDRPPRWTDMHHIVFWSQGGTTDRDNGVALCRHHHRLIHTSTWTVRLGPDRRPEFIPPGHIDPHRRPRRNHYHPRP
jgi:hypothetical protein